MLGIKSWGSGGPKVPPFAVRVIVQYPPVHPHPAGYFIAFLRQPPTSHRACKAPQGLAFTPQLHSSPTHIHMHPHHLIPPRGASSSVRTCSVFATYDRSHSGMSCEHGKCLDVIGLASPHLKCPPYAMRMADISQYEHVGSLLIKFGHRNRIVYTRVCTSAQQQ